VGDLVAHPSGRFLYALDSYSFPGLTGRAIDAADGSVREIAGSPFQTEAAGTFLGNRSLVIDASGRYAYLITGFSSTSGIARLTLEPATGTVVSSSRSPSVSPVRSPLALAADPSAEFLFAMTQRGTCCPGALDLTALAIDPGTGDTTARSGSAPASLPMPDPASPDLTVDPSGTLIFAVLDFTQTEVLHGTTFGPPGELFVFSFDPGSRALVPVAGSPFHLEAGAGPAVVAP
jgi:hypothetical protein